MKMILLLMMLLVPLSSANADTLVVFGQSTGLNLFTGNETNGVLDLNASGIPVVISTLNDAASNIDAFFSLDATSSGPAVNVLGGAWTQPASGMFSITSDVLGVGFNYLSGMFSGIQLGLVGGKSFVFGSANPPLSLSFTSDVVGMPLGLPTAMALSLTNVSPGVFISNSSFGDFNSNVSGTFSAEAAAIPEPATLILLGGGLAATLIRKRKLMRQIK